MKQIHCAALGAGLVAAIVGGTSTAHGQSADSLIDKLVDKGILTPKEATDLREEVDKDFTRSYQAKTGLKDWVTSLRMGGDFRGRYDSINSLDDRMSVRDRFRYRIRYGINAVMWDNLEVGLRLASGAVNGNPISRNQTYEDNGSLKGVGIDQAYGKFTPLRNDTLEASLTLGKMPNPYVFSDLVFDEDYTPEGLAANVNFLISDAHSLKLNAGAFMLDEIRTDSQDPVMFGAQARFDSKWSKHIESSAGVGLLSIWHKDGLRGEFSTSTVVTDSLGGRHTNSTTTAAAVPDISRGNTRNSAGFLQANFNPIVADASITYSLESAPFYTGPFPIRLGGDFIFNPAIPDRNKGYTVGVTFGKSGKKKTWDLSYRYKYLEGDAWYEEVVDSNSGAIWVARPTGAGSSSDAAYFAGTNIKGHMFKAQYSPFDSLTVAATYHLYRLIDDTGFSSTVSRPLEDSHAGRLMVDLVWKF